MASNDEEWKRKLLIQNIPDDWSLDMLENFVEVVTKAELVENEGVEHFCGVNHTALLTFTEPLTDQHLQNARAGSEQRKKPVTYSLIASAPTAVLVRDIVPSVTEDNLFYYFESSRSGGEEGAVEDCSIYRSRSMAVITFSKPEVAASVVSVREHNPSRGISITVESCYEQFHKRVLDGLEHPPAVPDARPPRGPARRGPRNHEPRPARGGGGPPKPYLLPNPQFEYAPQSNAASPRDFPPGVGDGQHQNFRVRNRNASNFPQAEQYKEYDQNAPHYNRGQNRRRRNKSRNKNRGQWGSRENLNQESSQRSRGSNEGSHRSRGSNEGSQRSRGRRPYQNRGRGHEHRGGFLSPSEEAELFTFETEQPTSPACSGSSRPIRLDADCNPVPYDDMSRSESYNDQSETSFEEFEFEDLSPSPQVDMEASKFATNYPHGSSAYDQSRQNVITKQSQFASEAKIVKQNVLAQGIRDSRNDRWAEPRQTPPPIATKPQIDLEKELEAEKLKQEKLELQRQLQKKDELREQDKLRYEQELQKIKEEGEKLKKRKKETMSFPSYQLQLMHDFAKSTSMCEIIIHDKEGKVEFDGTAEDVENAKVAFMCTLQDLAEDSITVSPTVSALLQSEYGQQYLTQLCQSVPGSSFEVQPSRVLCAASGMNDVQTFLDLLQRNLHKKTIKDVNKNIMSQLQTMKLQLENDFHLVRISLPADGSTEVSVEGINGDFELAARELQKLCRCNKPEEGKFHISGQLETKACKQWCTSNLDDVKSLILKNNGDITTLTDPNQVGFSYRCPKEVLPKVQHILNNILKMTKVSQINLQDQLKKYSERALVINGLYNTGIEPVCRQLECKLNDYGLSAIILINIPAKCSLPRFEYRQSKPSGAKAPHRSQPAYPVRRHHRPSGHRVAPRPSHHRNSIHPYKTRVGNSSLEIKSGDIMLEKVDAMVCVVAEDLDLKQTAVGQAVLKKYPQITVGQTGSAGSVISKPLPVLTPAAQLGLVVGGRQTSKFFHFAVLTKWSQHNVVANVKTVTQRCLQAAVANGNKSIAFPPLGVGRKFQLSMDSVVNAMVTTTHQFLQGNPGALQSVVFVIYDVSSARQFREAAKKIINPPPPVFLQSPQQAMDLQSYSEEEDYIDDDAYAAMVAASDDGDQQYDFYAQASDDSGDDFYVAQGRSSGGSDDDDDADEDVLDFFQLDENDMDLLDRNVNFVTAPPAQPHNPKAFNVEMCLHNQQDFTNVKTVLLRELKSTFVHEDRLTDIRTFKKLGSCTMDEIKTAAVNKCVVLSVESLGGRESLLVRGQKVGVTEVMALIKDKQHAYLQREGGSDHKGRSGDLPSESKRLRLPTYWNVCQNKIFKDLEQFIREHRTYGKLYTMGGDIQKEISTLIQKTWIQNLVGAGKDAVNLRHKNIQVQKVERLENPNLWEDYCTHRERLFRRCKQQPFAPIEKAKGSTGPLKTTSNIGCHSPFSKEIFSQVNEHYLFHGTKKDYIQAIHDQGLDTRIANEKAMLGRGIYASESSTKADQYTDEKANRTSGNKTMILLRVLLGEPFINKDLNPTKFSRPPCKQCYKDRCTCQGGNFFDSVIDDAGRNFREFVIYDRCMCYPEYFITYQRI